MKETMRQSTSATVIELLIANRPTQNIPGRRGRIIKSFIPRRIDQTIKKWFSGNDMEKYRVRETGDFDTADLIRIASFYSVPVYVIDFPQFLKRVGIDSLYWTFPNRKRVILVDDALEHEDKKFVLAHEVYHLFTPAWVSLGTVYKTESKDVLKRHHQQEHEADVWATKFLYPGGQQPKSKFAVNLVTSERIQSC